MRYYLTTPNGEKGPYEEIHILEWLRTGAMPTDALVRREDEATGRPASVVFPGEAPSAPAAFGAPQPPFGASPGSYGGSQPNMYAPPVTTGGSDWVHTNSGNFGQGFVFGFFCGCIALIWSYASRDMGSETKRGIRTGFVVAFAIGTIVRVIAAASR
jgi:hypothetical protein